MPFVKAARTGDIPVGRAKVVQIEDQDIALCNVGGTFYAVANVCTHDDGPLGEGYLLGEEIECPRHGGRFNVASGAVQSLPAMVPIPTFEVKVEGSDILVALE